MGLTRTAYQLSGRGPMAVDPLFMADQARLDQTGAVVGFSRPLSIAADDIARPSLRHNLREAHAAVPIVPGLKALRYMPNVHGRDEWLGGNSTDLLCKYLVLMLRSTGKRMGKGIH